MSHSSNDEIKCWLKSALRNENLLDFTLSRTGNSEKGEGYMGDIVFVDVEAETKSHSSKTYHLVLKCSKNSEALRASLPVKEAFENEIFFYQEVIPTFVDFQKRKSASDIFDSVPKCYGSYTSKNIEVLVLENLKSGGYYLCNSKEPLPTNHLKLVLKEYGKWHAISAAMQDQEPERIRKLAAKTKNLWKMFSEQTDIEIFFGAPIDETYELLKSDLSESTAQKLKDFKAQIVHIVKEVMDEPTYFSVVSHGDCWSNNFMFKAENENHKKPLSVAMLDWQTFKFSNPAMDVSYFLFSCASKVDLDNFSDLLKFYYDSFSHSVKLMKSDPDKIYPFSQFRKDFELFGKYGVLLTLLAVKVALSDKEEAPDFAETANGDFAKTFSFKNRDQALLKSRMLYIVEKIAELDIF